MKIYHRLTGETLFDSVHETIKETVEAAIATDADLSDADLSDADLSDADLSRANLSRANLIRADLSDADLSDADLSDANLPTIDRFENLRGAICARVCATPENLEMNAWHTCKTTHCLAGWATVIHPQGRLLESIYGTSVAAAMIFQVCEGEVPDFHSSNEDAMEWLKSGKTDVLVSE